MTSPSLEPLLTAEDYRAALDITPLFYDAVLDPARWPDVLQVVGDWFAPCRCVQFALSKISEVRALANFTYGLSDEELEIYLNFNDHMNGDPRRPGILKRWNRPWHCRQIVSEQELHDSPIYREAFGPLDI